MLYISINTCLLATCMHDHDNECVDKEYVYNFIFYKYII